MPIDNPEIASNKHVIVRVARVVRGTVNFKLECAPRFDYGRIEHQLSCRTTTLFSSPNLEISPHPTSVLIIPGKPDNRVARQQFTLHAGETDGLHPDDWTRGLNRWRPVRGACRQTARRDDSLLAWLGEQEHVQGVAGVRQLSAPRSPQTAFTYARPGIGRSPDSGLAGTSGGQAQLGYRYTWVRDGSFSVSALMELGYNDEAAAFAKWLSQRVEESVIEGVRSTQTHVPNRRVIGFAEIELDHLEGYESPRQSASVTAPLINCSWTSTARPSTPLPTRAAGSIDVLRHLAEHGANPRLAGRQLGPPDEGHLGDARAAKGTSSTHGSCAGWHSIAPFGLLATKGLPGPISKWRESRDEIYQQIMDRGFHRTSRRLSSTTRRMCWMPAFSKMPLTGFISPRDPAGCPRWMPSTPRSSRTRWSSATTQRRPPDGLDGDEGNVLAVHVLVRGRAGEGGTAGRGSHRV